ncbi:hypothetical protein N7474_007316 [Penicillium riverlandense]|uniref:uncharacterized protein n=1 Tax=Penicillium riverlandense TaxID=1903569 RepID=UPI002549521A|nr:uncharacterized protein N7474_007316 [Penicillium riverlandense]KAJ5815539.1 hypothetical protein N7474_007316 [Penicillium riverlandense]
MAALLPILNTRAYDRVAYSVILLKGEGGSDDEDEDQVGDEANINTYSNNQDQNSEISLGTPGLQTQKRKKNGLGQSRRSPYAFPRPQPDLATPASPPLSSSPATPAAPAPTPASTSVSFNGARFMSAADEVLDRVSVGLENMEDGEVGSREGSVVVHGMDEMSGRVREQDCEADDHELEQRSQDEGYDEDEDHDDDNDIGQDQGQDHGQEHCQDAGDGQDEDRHQNHDQDQNQDQNPYHDLPEPIYTGGIWITAKDHDEPQAAPTIPGSPYNPRKRSATVASLPDSISDSERKYEGYKHKLVAEESIVSPSKSTNRHSRLPRPISLKSPVEVKPENIPLPRDSVPVLEVDFRRFEQIDSLAKERGVPLVKKNLDRLPSIAKKGTFRPEIERLSTVVNINTSSAKQSSSLPDYESDRASSENDGIPLVGHFLCELDVSPDTHGSNDQPRLVLIDGTFYVQTSPKVKPAIYEVHIKVLLHVRKARPEGWNALMIPGLPRLRAGDYGYIVLCMPLDKGIEFRTTPFKRAQFVEGCLMAQFATSSNLVVPLRIFDKEYYGYVKDFKVKQMIRSEIVDENKEVSLVKYNAICSIEPVQRIFRTDQCSFVIYVHGGPPGEYACDLTSSENELQTIDLSAEPSFRQLGLAALEVRCRSSDLEKFVVTWSVQLSRTNLSTWLPRIKATANTEGNKSEMSLIAHLGLVDRPALQPTETKGKHRDCPVCNTTHTDGQTEPELSCIWKSAKWWLFLNLVCWLFTICAYVFLPKSNDSSPVETALADTMPLADTNTVEIPKVVLEQNEQLGEFEHAGLVEEDWHKFVVPGESLTLRDRFDRFFGWCEPVIVHDA